MPMIDVGQSAPDFTLPDQDGKPHALSAYRGRHVILYFYPKDDTPGCTAEACGFRDNLPDFAGINAAILGISADDVESHAKFARKHGLNFPILADRMDAGMPAVCSRYGVWVEKSMYGKKYMGVQRSTYHIDPRGVVANRWDKVKPEVHPQEVLAALAGGGGGTSVMVEAKPKAKRKTAGAKARPKSASTAASKPARTTARGAAQSRTAKKKTSARKAR